MSDLHPTTSADAAPQTGPQPTPQPSLAARLIKGSSSRIIAQIMPLFVNLALTPFVITSLGRSGYGLWLVLSSLTHLLGHFDGGIGRSAQHFFTLLAGKDDRASNTRLLISLSAAVIVVSAVLLVPALAFAGQLAAFFQTPPQLQDDATFLLQVLLLLVATSLLRNLFAAVLHAYERFTLTSMSSLASYTGYAIGMVWALSSGLGLRGIAYAFIAQHVIATLVIVPPTLRHLSRQGLGLVTRERFLEVARVSWRIQIAGTLTVAAMQAPLLIMGRMQPVQVADFGPGSTFAQQLKLIPMNGVVPIQAMLGRSVGAKGAAATLGEARTLQRTWVRAVTGWCVVGAPAAYVGVNIWLPLEGHLAGQVAAVMLVAQWLSLLPQVLLQWQLLQGRPNFEMWGSGVTAVVLVASSLLLIPQFGALGAAAAAVLGYLVGLAMLLFVSRSLPVPAPSLLGDIPWWQSVLSGTLSLGLVAAMSHLITQGYLPDGGVGLLLCGAAASPALALFVVTTWGPRRVWDLVRTRISPRSGRDEG
ncbi:lipopolysaccharide biosynthesis protein [Ornithinimicrobium sufpigmenti]|uniref:lipopolysaccharide biosynthesis protein n=1 Tax=Ornithinimicrobium sufpigmenti TaxID=2508882 RepID=UPI0010359F35|nr:MULTISPECIES: polysaccharide biosynthesis C-terminal domain-containing protein [unclassified Ornithinimicrobium]